MTNENYQNVGYVGNEDSNGTKEETQKIEDSLKDRQRPEIFGRFLKFNWIFLLITLFILLGAIVNYSLTLSLQGRGFSIITVKNLLYSLGIIDLKNASLETVAKVTLPDESDKIRPIKINGKQVRLSLDSDNLDLIMSQDPFPPNGSRSFPPYGPGDNPPGLTSEQARLYNKLMYGTEENNFQDAVGGCLFCNAPGGAGGCFKKRVIRGLTYVMIKQGYSEKEIVDELRVWLKFFFPGLAVKWTKYYAQKGIGSDEIPIDVRTFSLQGKRFVDAALAGEDLSKVPDQVGGCFR